MPRRRIHVDVTPKGVIPTLKAIGDGTSVSQDTLVKSKIFAHFIKGKISLSPMETIIMILRELEHLESLVRLARRKKDLEAIKNQVSMVSTIPTLRKIYINKTH